MGIMTFKAILDSEWVDAGETISDQYEVSFYAVVQDESAPFEVCRILLDGISEDVAKLKAERIAVLLNQYGL
jgi:hypothetical protein